MKKNNVVRELEKEKIDFKTLNYEFDENDLSAISLSCKTGIFIGQIFKTLILFTDKKELIVACIQGDGELDLKNLAKLSGCKKVEMVGVKELFENTGYIRGGCSPIGIKKRHRTFIDKSAENFENIYVSAGVRGTQIEINPHTLIKYLGMEVFNLQIDTI
ncbi:MAG: Cys-tRNA(Pro) deacylase [Fusobacteriaceae bacterium]